MLRPKQRITVAVITTVTIIILVIVSVKSCSTIKTQNIEIDSLTTTVLNKTDSIEILNNINANNENKISFLANRVDDVEAEKERLSYSLDSAIFLLEKKTKQNSILKKVIDELNIAINFEKQKKSNSEKRIDEIILENTNLKRIRFDTIQPNKTIEEIKIAYAPRCALMFSLNQPDCQSVFKSILKYSPKICSRQIEYIYGPAGENLRRSGRKLNINDYESLYSFVIAANLNPDNVSPEEIKELLVKSLQSGDLKRAAVKIYGVTEDNYERAIAVVLSVFKLT